MNGLTLGFSSMCQQNKNIQLLITILGLIFTAYAQGSLGGSQSSCSASNAWVYKGCYADVDSGPHAGFTWQLSSDPHSLFYYPGYEDSMTVNICLRACRGHGFRYAALYDTNSCYCSSSLPDPLSREEINESQRHLHGRSSTRKAFPSICQLSEQGCTGNASEYCGSSVASDIYEDPSFITRSSASSAANFNYLGCFTNVAPGPLYHSIGISNTSDCGAYCGELGYSFMGSVGRKGLDGKDEATCSCGTEIQVGNQVDEANCNYYCTSSTESL